MEKIHESTLERIRFGQGELRAFRHGPGPSRVSGLPHGSCPGTPSFTGARAVPQLLPLVQGEHIFPVPGDPERPGPGPGKNALLYINRAFFFRCTAKLRK